MSIQLSEVISAFENDTEIKDVILEYGFCYGIKVDCESFSPPEGLGEFSFVAEFENGELKEELVDVLISYALSGAKVILEINENDREHIEYILNVANNIEFDVAAVPSDELVRGNVDSWDSYIDFVTESTQLFMNKRSKSSLLPAVNFVEYMFAECYNGGTLEKLEPKDAFTREKFVNIIPQSVVDDFKGKLRTVVYEHFGGKEKFETFANLVLQKTKDKLTGNLDDLLGRINVKSSEDKTD